MDSVYLLWTAPGELVGVYASRVVAEADAEIERARCRALGMPEAAAHVLVREVRPRTSLLRRRPDPRPAKWSDLTDEERRLALSLGRTEQVFDAEYADWLRAQESGMAAGEDGQGEAGSRDDAELIARASALRADLVALASSAANAEARLGQALALHRLNLDPSWDALEGLPAVPAIAADGHVARVRRTPDQGGSPSTCTAVCSCGWAGESRDEAAGGTVWQSLLDALHHAGVDTRFELAMAVQATEVLRR